MEIISDKEKLFTLKRWERKDKESDNMETLEKAIATFTLKKLGNGYNAKIDEGKHEKADFWLVEYETNGQKRVLNVPSDIFVDRRAFSRFFVKYLGFFHGTENDLTLWATKLQLETGGVEYFLIQNKYGRYRIGEEDIWVFKNGFYFRNAFHKPEHFYYFDNDTKGIRFELDNLQGYAPFYNTNMDTEIIDIKNIITDLNLFFTKRPFIIAILLGFYASSLRYTEFLKILNLGTHCILGLFGATEIGKTEFITLLNTLIGMEHVQPMGWQASSNFINQLQIGLNSHFPLWRDEYRDTKNGNEGNKKEEFLRSVYNRMSILKGKRDLTASVFEVCSTLILSGEDMPQDPAVQRRSINILMGKDDKVDIKTWIEIKNRSGDWFRFFHFVIAKQLDEERIKKTYYELLSSLAVLGIGNNNYAYIFTVFLEIFYSDREEEYLNMKETLRTSVFEYFSINHHHVVTENNLERFFEAVEAAIAKGIKGVYLKTYIEFIGNEVRIYLQGLAEVLSEQGKNKHIAVNSLRNILCENFNAKISKQRINFSVRNCIIILQKDAPEYILDFKEKLEDERRKIEEEELKYLKHSL